VNRLPVHEVLADVRKGNVMKKASFFLLLFLCGCAPQKIWFSPAKNYAEAEQDYHYCQNKPAGSTAECMKAKGYYLVDKKFADVYRNVK
jgi:hypothetical protein